MHISPDERMQQLVELAKSLGTTARLSRVQLDMLLQHNYLQEYYGLKVDPHNLKMPLVEWMPESNVFGLTRWSTRAEEFATNEIYATYGLSLTEFLNLPSAKVDHLLYLRRQQKVEERAARDKAKLEAERKVKTELPTSGVAGFNQLDFP